jgi:hypothetical protein
MTSESRRQERLQATISGPNLILRKETGDETFVVELNDVLRAELISSF